MKGLIPPVRPAAKQGAAPVYHAPKLWSKPPFLLKAWGSVGGKFIPKLRN